MGEFGIALKEARKEAQKKLRETAKAVDLSVGYISDIEQGRKGAPDVLVVQKLQEFLGITDNRLIRLADSERTKMPTQMIQSLQSKPKLNHLFFRLKDMSDEDLEKFINHLPEE